MRLRTSWHRYSESSLPPRPTLDPRIGKDRLGWAASAGTGQSRSQRAAHHLVLAPHVAACPIVDVVADHLTVGQAAELAGVTVRTLHHYDEIGLLRPSTRTAAGHRAYSAGDVEAPVTATASTAARSRTRSPTAAAPTHTSTTPLDRPTDRPAPRGRMPTTPSGTGRATRRPRSNSPRRTAVPAGETRGGSEGGLPASNSAPAIAAADGRPDRSHARRDPWAGAHAGPMPALGPHGDRVGVRIGYGSYTVGDAVGHTREAGRSAARLRSVGCLRLSSSGQRCHGRVHEAERPRVHTYIPAGEPKLSLGLSDEAFARQYGFGLSTLIDYQATGTSRIDPNVRIAQSLSVGARRVYSREKAACAERVRAEVGDPPGVMRGPLEEGEEITAVSDRANADPRIAAARGRLLPVHCGEGLSRLDGRGPQQPVLRGYGSVSDGLRKPCRHARPSWKGLVRGATGLGPHR